MVWDGDVMLVVLSAVRAVAGMGGGLVVEAREKGLVGVPRETMDMLVALGRSWGLPEVGGEGGATCEAGRGYGVGCYRGGGVRG